MKRLMSLYVLAVLLLTVGFANAQAGLVNLIGSNVVDSAGNKLVSGSISFAPVDNKGNPISYHIANLGQVISRPVTTQVNNGAFNLLIADTSQTSPLNVCFNVTIVDNNTGANVLGSGYSCVQPSRTATWCTTFTCTFDTYPPNLAAQSLIQTGPQGTIGPQGPTGATGPPVTFLGAYNPATTYIAGQAVFFGGSSYASLVGSNVGNQPDTHPSSWGLLASPIGYTAVNKAGDTLTGSLFQPTMLMAFGDSITHGSGALSPSDGYAYWLSRAIQYPILDVAVPGASSMTQDPVIYANPIPTTVTSIVLYTIGTNNVGLGGTNISLEQSYSLNISAQYAWMALPLANKTLFKNVTTHTGSWSPSTVFGAGDPGATCSTTGCTDTFSFTGSTLYLVTGATDGNAATATLTCDGTATGATLRFQGVGGVAMGAPASLLTRVTGLTSGSHSCVVTATSSGGNITLEWAAGLNGSLPSGAPVVLAGSIPLQNPVEAVSPAWRALQLSATTQLFNDGLTNVVYVDDTSSLSAPTNYFDGLHPNDFGHYLMAQPFINAVSAKLGKAFVEPPFVYNTVQNSAPGGNATMGLGVSALQSNSIGFNNTAVGANSAQNNSTGNDNTCVGSQSCSTNSTGNANTAVGAVALQLNTGSFNTAMGSGALAQNTTATNNSAFGANALQNNTGQNNSAFGMFALQANTTGTSNTSMGQGALQLNTIGMNNVAIGFEALQASTSGNSNVGVGINAGGQFTTGGANTAIGTQAGFNAGTPLPTVNNSVYIGNNANSSTDGLTNQVVIGQGAQGTASNQVMLGNASITSTVLHGVVSIVGASAATSATAGTGSALPATPVGYLGITLNGTSYRIPYYLP